VQRLPRIASRERCAGPVDAGRSARAPRGGTVM
jgi:hypothetical protein